MELETQSGTAPATVSAPPRTLIEGFWRTCEERGDQIALRTRCDSVSLTWSQMRARVNRIAAGLHALGVDRGDVVALMIDNRPEFTLVDLAVVTLGATPFSIYPTLAPGQIEPMLADSGARLAILSRAHLSALRQAASSLTSVDRMVLVDPCGADDELETISLADVEAMAAPDFDPAERVAQASASDVLTLIYTSGTTGPPKGVELTHRSVLTAAQGLRGVLPLPAGAQVIGWLPTAHIAGRLAHHYLPVLFAFTTTMCPDAREVAGYLAEVRPTWFFAVPRIWEKLKAGVEARIATLPDEQRAAIERALREAIEKVRLEQAGNTVPDELAGAVAVADAEIFAGLRRQLGLDQLLAAHAAGAPTPVPVLEFFHAIGVPVGEAYGMTESCSGGAINPPDRIRIGSVGRPTDGVEVRVADDGEILLRGEMVFTRYRNLPEKTAEAFIDGWLQTGDIGRIDEDGYLYVVDRKKELIISAGGKNMSPLIIEATIKAKSPLIGQICAIGNRRPYNTALVALDRDAVAAWAAANGRGEHSAKDLAGLPEIREAVEQAVQAGNQELARVEQIKRFAIVAEDWTAGGEVLTPTMKLKRREISAKYAATIDALYR